MIRMKVGSRIKELRKTKGLSQEKFALEVGLDRTYIASVESGKRNISIINLEKIWIYFSLTPKDFFDNKIFYEDKIV